MTRIVVGVDGSSRSKDALRWAAGQAEATGATLDVVMTWERINPEAWIPHEPRGSDDMLMIRRVVDRIVQATLGEHPGVTVETRALEGPAAKKLLEAAKDADLLVLGNRGHGGFAGLLLGSVSMQCVTHAPCPVVVVHAAGKGRR